jgi:hypothetical protein
MFFRDFTFMTGLLTAGRGTAPENRCGTAAGGNVFQKKRPASAGRPHCITFTDLNFPYWASISI